MRLALHVRDLVLVSWKTDRESVARVLPVGLEPATVAGDYLVSLVALAYDGGQLGWSRVPPFSQLNVRTYVTFGNEPAVFFLRAHVTPVGMVGIVFGAPYRPARIAVRSDAIEAPGLGVSVRFRALEPAEPGELARHELGLFEAAGLRGFRVRRGAAEWQRAVPLGPARADVVLAVGFDAGAEPSVLHAREASFETEVPPRRVDTRTKSRA
ncbi:MAG: DUF2071 domain-containing protein [Actinomycetota bacterium]|nr:DUF2071 domain-containing protein [Actinomycetota bacterium]